MSHMPRLTRERIGDLKQRLAQWQAPEEMMRLVEPINSTTLFNQGGLAFLRDAWIAAEFGRIRKAERVRLVDDAWPDFELELDGQNERYEAAEVDDPARRRGDEYRNNTRGVEHDPVEDWIARAEQTPAWIAEVCQKKADKRYQGRANLVIYLNVGEYGIRQKQIEGCFPSATSAVKDHFDAAWILWKAKAYCVWVGGEPCPSSLALAKQ